jgi:hypothetical protein
MNFTYRLSILAAFLTSAFVVGCSKAPGDLSGTVTYKGKSVVTGTVTAYDSDKRPYQGAIEQGQYTIKGIPAGPVTLIVVSQDPAAASQMPGGRPAGPGREGGREGGRGAPATPIAGWFAIPKKYEDINTTDLKTEVKSGPNNTFNIELKD